LSKNADGNGKSFSQSGNKTQNSTSLTQRFGAAKKIKIGDLDSIDSAEGVSKKQLNKDIKNIFSTSGI